MPLISGTTPSMIGGVSQQDASVRQASQLEEAMNCNLSPARGAGPRPPATFVQVLASDIPDNAFFHSIVRDARERYLVVIYQGRVRVFDHVTGKEYLVVADEPSRAYLNTQFDPYVSLRATTIEDYTIIANREVVVRMTGEKVPGVISGSVQTFQDLPKDSSGTAIFEVRGAADSSFGRYYVQGAGYKVWQEVAKPGVLSTLDGASMPHGLKRIPDSVNPDGFYFSYGPLDYEKRLAGDETSVPLPSMVGQRIGNVGYHRDRLVIVVGENVLMSEIGRYFNFWRTTVTSLLDSDTIDITMPSEGVSEITHLISYQKVLLLFASGNKTVFQLSGVPTLTPKTVKVDLVNAFEVSPTIKPVMAGTSLFFCDDSSKRTWTTVREYFVSNEQVTPEAANVTAHVPAYVPGNTRCMTAVPDADLLLISHLAPSGPQVFVHQFKWNGDQKQQSAWHPWKIETAGAVVHMHAIGPDLYVIAKSPGGGVELLRMDLSQAPVFPLVSSDFDIHLDRREVVTPVYQPFGNYTDITVPFILPTLENLVVLKTTDWPSPGAYLETTGATLVNGGQTLRLQGNAAQGRVVVGYRYRRRVTLSQPYVKDQNGISKLIGRLQLRRMTVRFAAAAFFRCLVYPKGRPEAIDTLVPQLVHTFTGRTVGDEAFRLSVPKVHDGEHTFLVASNAEHVRIAFDSDSPYPCWWQSAAWEALYTTKVRM
ncbi:hypothetical protein ISN75_14140 [Dyella marensis]|uniref:phage nozzle protein n=1 Tax=Dyella marensis TaxID=500610 RepID=UPI0031D453F0